LRTHLARVHNASPGDSVGYGRTWRARLKEHRKPTLVGLMPVGYADGYGRLLSNRGQVLVGGVRCTVAGRVSMDQTSIDLSSVPEAKEGDEVVLIGGQGDGYIGADEIAAWAGTISYEVLCGISQRVPRRYWRDGRPVATCTLLGCQDAAATGEGERTT
jgi:alanine racemase